MADNISVKITADIVDLQAQFSVARAESTALTTELNKLARQAATTGMTDELKAGLTQAAEAALVAKTKTSDLGDELKSKLKPALDDAGKGAKGFGGILGTVLNGAAFLEFEQFAKQAMDTVKKAFEETIGKAEEFGLANARMSGMLGMSNEQAVGLSSALKGVGVSSDEYETMAMRMEMRLRSQEATFTSLGMKTRDQNGLLLTGQQLMDSAVATMETYRSGTDQNEFALDLFGRRAADVYDIMRAGKTVQQEDIDILKAQGVQTGAMGATSAQLEEKLAQLKLEWDGMGIAIGQRLMPVLTAFTSWATGTGAPVLRDLGIALTAVALAWDGVARYLIIVWDSAMAVVVPLADAFMGLAKVIQDSLAGHWDQIVADFDHGMAKVEESANKHLKGVAKAFADNVKGLKADIAGAISPKTDHANPYAPKSGDKHFVDPQLAAEAARKAAEAARKAQEVAKKAAEEQRKLNDEQAGSEEKLGLEKVSAAESANASMLALGQETADQFVAQQIDLENQKYAIELEGLKKKASADVGDKLAHQKDLDEIKLLEQTHQDALTAIQQQAALRRMQLSKQETAEFIANDNSRLQNGMAALEEEYKQHDLTVQQKAAAEKQLTATIYGEELNRLDAELSSLTKGTAAWNEAYKQRQKIAEDLQKAVQKIDNDTYNTEDQQWKKLATSFNNSLNGMIMGTMTWQKALTQIFDNIATSFLQLGERMVENWIETEVLKLATTKATETTSATGQISAAAGIAAANTFASISAIPIVGPSLAPAAAAAALSAVLSFEGLAFAEQGMVLGQDQLIFAHKKEMVLPADLSSGLQDMIRTGNQVQAAPAGGSGGGPGGGDIHIHIHALDAGGVAKMMRGPVGDELVKGLIAQRRNGAGGGIR